MNKQSNNSTRITDYFRSKSPLTIESSFMAEVLDSHEQMERQLRLANETIKRLSDNTNKPTIQQTPAPIDESDNWPVAIILLIIWMIWCIWI